MPAEQSLLVSLVQMNCPKVDCVTDAIVGTEAFIACAQSLERVQVPRFRYACKVLLVLWTYELKPKYHLIELFAGSGNVGAVWRRSPVMFALYVQGSRLHRGPI